MSLPTFTPPPPNWIQNICFGIPTRSPRKASVDSFMPEAIVRVLFDRWFKRKYGPDSTVMTQLEFATELIAGQPLLNKLLEAMASDFTNAWTMSSVKGKVGNLKMGRLRKPDVIGFSQVGPLGMVLELIEVTTEGEAKDTINEDLTPKLQILNEKVIPLFQMALQNDLSMSIPAITVKASTWRPSAEDLTWPFIPSNFTPRKIEWICFRPTFRFTPPNGTDGLVLYEIHSIGIPQEVPEDVLNRLRQRLRNQFPGPQLLPFLADHWQTNPYDADVVKGIAIVAGVAIIVAIAVLLLPEEGAIASAAATGAAVLRGAMALAVAAPIAIEKAKWVLQSLNMLPEF